MKKGIKEYFKKLIDDEHGEPMEVVEYSADLCNIVENQPTAYDVEKVVEELKNRVLDTTDSLTGIGAKWAYKGAINIVKAGGTDE